MNHAHKTLLVLVFLIMGVSVEALSFDNPSNQVEQQPDKDKVQASTELDDIKHEIEEIKKKVEKPPKDSWDKLSAASGLASGILVALIGFYATQIYTRGQRTAEDARKERELKNLQVQTVEKFFVHLSSGEQSKTEAAIQAIASLGNEELATKIALIFGGTGARSALSKLASVSDPKTIKSAEFALGELFASVRQSVVRVESAGKLVATGFFINGKGLLITTAHVAKSLKADEIQIEMASGNRVAAVIQRIQEDQDLAILQAQINFPVVPLKLTPATIDIGSLVIALGHSPRAKWLASVGTISDISVNEDSTIFGEHRIGVTMESYPGFSGAPVLDAQGGFVGLVQAYAQSSNQTILISESLVKSVFQQELANGGQQAI